MKAIINKPKNMDEVCAFIDKQNWNTQEILYFLLWTLGWVITKFPEKETLKDMIINYIRSK